MNKQQKIELTLLLTLSISILTGILILGLKMLDQI